ncbi:MAG: hypothetical protein KDA99_22270, partial [Planctomycetales bacterium]|nr:hypothetical protein [Planctomycetales bacterium]
AACGGDRLGQCGCDNEWRHSFQTAAPAGQAGEEAKCDNGALQLDRGRVWCHPCVTKSQNDDSFLHQVSAKYC